MSVARPGVAKEIQLDCLSPLRGFISDRSTFALGQTEPVAGIIFKEGFDSVWPVRRRRHELHSLRLEFFVCGAAIVRIEDARAERAFLDQGSELSGGLFV